MTVADQVVERTAKVIDFMLLRYRKRDAVDSTNSIALSGCYVSDLLARYQVDVLAVSRALTYVDVVLYEHPSKL